MAAPHPHKPAKRHHVDANRASTALEKSLRHCKLQLESLETLRQCRRPPVTDGQLTVVHSNTAAANPREAPDMRAYSLSTDAFRTTDVWTVAYSGTPDAVAKAIKEDCDMLGSAETVAANALGYVCFSRRYLGIKKCRGVFVLGLGAKASPLEFAAAAGRVDNCLQLLRSGALPDSGSPSASEIARVNGFQAIVDLIATFKKTEAEKKMKKKCNKGAVETRPGDAPGPLTSALPAGLPPAAAVIAASVPPRQIADPTLSAVPHPASGSFVGVHPISGVPPRAAPDP
jgi:hypothetical protein